MSESNTEFSSLTVPLEPFTYEQLAIAAIETEESQPTFVQEAMLLRARLLLIHQAVEGQTFCTFENIQSGRGVMLRFDDGLRTFDHVGGHHLDRPVGDGGNPPAIMQRLLPVPLNNKAYECIRIRNFPRRMAETPEQFALISLRLRAALLELHRYVGGSAVARSENYATNWWSEMDYGNDPKLIKFSFIQGTINEAET